jgi:hypothetical protein
VSTELSQAQERLDIAVAKASEAEAERASAQAEVYRLKRLALLAELLESGDLSGISIYRNGVPIL